MKLDFWVSHKGSPSFTQLIKSSTSCIALYKTFHCGNDKLTPTLVGIVSVFQNRRSTLLLPFHSVSSAYLPPPRGTLTGMFNDWVWSLANVTAKASCSRSSCVRSCLMENGHCILRREGWPWVFTNWKNWKKPYLYLKTEGQNWGLWTIKWLGKIKWKRLRNRTWT
jgi:hypothetical protein